MTANSNLPRVSVVIPTHNPREDYLARVLDALRAQTLDQSAWELVVVDNNSKPALVGDRSQASGNRKDINSREKAQEERNCEAPGDRWQETALQPLGFTGRRGAGGVCLAKMQDCNNF